MKSLSFDQREPRYYDLPCQVVIKGEEKAREDTPILDIGVFLDGPARHVGKFSGLAGDVFSNKFNKLK